MAFIDILSWHASGAPGSCVEHDGTRAVPDGATRMTTEEYRAQEPAWASLHAFWMSNQTPVSGLKLLSPLPRLAFISMIEDGLGIDYNALPELIDQHVTNPGQARRVKRAVQHGVVFDASDEPIDGVGAIRWLAQRLGVTDEQFVALWRAAGG